MKDPLKNKIIFLQVLIVVFVILIIMIAMGVGGGLKLGSEKNADDSGEQTMYGQLDEFGEEAPESTNSSQSPQDY